MPTGVIPSHLGDGPWPDTDGFRDAQDRLIEGLGEDVTFITPEPKVYAPDVMLDPETGEPFDPIAEPISGGGETAVTLRVVPIEGHQRADDETEVRPMGLMDTLSPVFIVHSGDAPQLEGAVYVDHNGERYHITDVKNDDDRYLVYTEAT
jgi:hypothetical protein